MNDIAKKAILYDFYGELLTDHQKKVYEDAVMNDLSLSELASEYGISRQGAHDLLKRCDAILEDYENKLHLVARFGELKSIASDMVEGLEALRKTDDPDTKEKIFNRLKEQISLMEEL
ncbi:MAG: DNA-binding protein [Lachnospiraceae bacterium]|nr:DNA-binding protein [Lachnospiraceae bacterium]